MASEPRYVYLPVSVAATGAPEQVLDAIDIQRAPNPDGEQDDHSSAFALLKQVLLSQISLGYTDDDRVHVTPVFTALLDISQRELNIYLEFMKSEKIFEKLHKVHEKIFPDEAGEKQEDEKEKKEKEESPTLKPLGGIGSFPSTERVNAIIEQIANKLKSIPVKSRERDLFRDFFNVWGLMIPYIHLNELRDELLKEVEKSEGVANKLRGSAEKYVCSSLPLDPKNQSDTIKKIAQLAYMAGAYIHGILPGRIESMANAFAQFLNKLPFATFKKVGGVSGRSEFEGTYVAKAMNELRASDFKEIDKTAIKVIVKNITTLLDFNPLNTEAKENLEQESIDIFTGKRPFNKRAIHSLLIRDDKKTVFVHVVARHWRFVCLAFPALKNETAIMDDFIKGMFERWKIKSTKRPGYKNDIIKIIEIGDSISAVQLSPRTSSIMSPSFPRLESQSIGGSPFPVLFTPKKDPNLTKFSVAISFSDLQILAELKGIKELEERSAQQVVLEKTGAMAISRASSITSSSRSQSSSSSSSSNPKEFELTFASREDYDKFSENLEKSRHRQHESSMLSQPSIASGTTLSSVLVSPELVSINLSSSSSTSPALPYDKRPGASFSLPSSSSGSPKPILHQASRTSSAPHDKTVTIDLTKARELLRKRPSRTAITKLDLDELQKKLEATNIETISSKAKGVPVHYNITFSTKEKKDRFIQEYLPPSSSSGSSLNSN